MRAFNVIFLFLGTLATAAGYGATFLLTDHFLSLGGSEIQTGWTLGGAVVGTFVGVPLVGWLGKRFGGARLAALGALAIAIGYIVLSGVTTLSPLVVVPGFLIGLGWGAFYLAAPMSVSERATDAERGFWFTRFGAFQMAGIGGSPVLADLLARTFQLPTGLIFRAVGAVCILASLLLWTFERLAPRPTGVSTSLSSSVGWFSSIRIISRTRALYPILMVCLGACVFTGMMTFQSSLVRSTGLDASVFFITYAVVVVGSRFVLAPSISRANGDRISILLLTFMASGVFAMFAIAYGVTIQVLSAIFLGLGYGLVYTVIQTQVVNDTPVAYRHGALTWFVIAYFIGIFGFPVIGGWIIVHAGAQVFLACILLCAVAELFLAIVRWRRHVPGSNAAAFDAASKRVTVGKGEVP